MLTLVFLKLQFRCVFKSPSNFRDIGSNRQIQNTTFGGIQGFSQRPSTPWFDDSGNFAGVVHQERNWTYVLVQGAGHEVPEFQPEFVRIIPKIIHEDHFILLTLLPAGLRHVPRVHPGQQPDRARHQRLVDTHRRLGPVASRRLQQRPAGPELYPVRLRHGDERVHRALGYDRGVGDVLVRCGEQRGSCCRVCECE